MRQNEVETVRAAVEQLLSTNRKQGHDTDVGADYDFLCPSPRHYPWQWFWDSCFHAIAIAHVSPQQAQAELRTLLAGQDEDGFIGHIQFWGVKLKGLFHLEAFIQVPFGHGLRHTGLMQPPMLAQAVEQVASTTGDVTFVPPLMEALDRYHEWLATNRAPDPDGLLVIVSPYESGMDQSPTFDRAMGARGPVGLWSLGLRDRLLDLRNWMRGYNSRRMVKGGFRVKDGLVNALYADSLATMARLHRAYGMATHAEAYAAKARAVEQSVLEKLYDRSAGALMSLQGKQERRTAPLTVGGLAGLILGGLPAADAEDLVKRNLHNPERFWLRYPLPSVSATEKSFNPRQRRLIWRGPAWVNTNWLVWKGLKRHGFDDVASHLAGRTVAMVAQQGLREFYNPLSGRGMGARSFGWSALALDMALDG